MSVVKRMFLAAAVAAAVVVGTVIAAAHGPGNDGVFKGDGAGLGPVTSA